MEHEHAPTASVPSVAGAPIVCQKGEVLLCSTISPVPWSHCWTWQDRNGSEQGASDPRMGATDQGNRTSIILGACQLLPPIHQGLFSHHRTLDRHAQEGPSLGMERA